MKNKLPEHLKSGTTIKLELGNDLKISTAGKVAIVMELLGGQPIYDEYGEEIGTTPSLITEEQALELLGVKKDKT